MLLPCFGVPCDTHVMKLLCPGSMAGNFGREELQICSMGLERVYERFLRADASERQRIRMIAQQELAAKQVAWRSRFTLCPQMPLDLRACIEEHQQAMVPFALGLLSWVVYSGFSTESQKNQPWVQKRTPARKSLRLSLGDSI